MRRGVRDSEDEVRGEGMGGSEGESGDNSA